MDLPKIKCAVKLGEESFVSKDKEVKLIDFWRWNQSNLLENRTRGVLAEFIVAQALGIQANTRVEWDNFDLITEEGLKIEVKSAAYIQSWEQKNYSKIIFGIADSLGAMESELYDGNRRRWADYYVFCLLKTKNQDITNPLDLEQWDFYVLRTSILDSEKSGQKSISLKALLRLNPVVCKFDEIKEVINY